MRRSSAAILLPLLAAAACSSAPTAKTAGAVSYYAGPTASFSPDGRLPYDSVESAVKREVLQDGALIRETLTQPGRAPGMSPSSSVTVLQRRGRSLVYDASDSSGTFTGKVVFRGRGLKAWTYDFQMKGGGYLSGSGELTSAGLKTRKLITGPGRPRLVQEVLPAQTEEQYRARLDEMKPRPGSE